MGLRPRTRLRASPQGRARVASATRAPAKIWRGGGRSSLQAEPLGLCTPCCWHHLGRGGSGGWLGHVVDMFDAPRSLPRTLAGRAPWRRADLRRAGSPTHSVHTLGPSCSNAHSVACVRCTRKVRVRVSGRSVGRSVPVCLRFEPESVLGWSWRSCVQVVGKQIGSPPMQMRGRRRTGAPPPAARPAAPTRPGVWPGLQQQL